MLSHPPALFSAPFLHIERTDGGGGQQVSQGVFIDSAEKPYRWGASPIQCFIIVILIVIIIGFSQDFLRKTRLRLGVRLRLGATVGRQPYSVFRNRGFFSRIHFPLFAAQAIQAVDQFVTQCPHVRLSCDKSFPTLDRHVDG